MKELSGWGRHPVVRADEREAEDLEAASAGAALSRGLGRSYGDASLPARGSALCTRRADRILAFDPDRGVLRAEAGLSLRALNEVFPPRGWASPVSPGTQYVTLGGMVASDVHGKNHHVAGTFGEYVRALRMRVGDGRVLEIDEASEPELFRATLGGMGLTGHILEVELQLERIPSFWIWGRSERARDLDELIALLRTASARSPFAAAWVDTTRAARRSGAASSRAGAMPSRRGARGAAAPARAPRGAVRSARLARRRPGASGRSTSCTSTRTAGTATGSSIRSRSSIRSTRCGTGTASTGAAAWSSTSAWFPRAGDGRDLPAPARGA